MSEQQSQDKQPQDSLKNKLIKAAKESTNKQKEELVKKIKDTLTLLESYKTQYQEVLDKEANEIASVEQAIEFLN